MSALVISIISLNLGVILIGGMIYHFIRMNRLEVALNEHKSRIVELEAEDSFILSAKPSINPMEQEFREDLDKGLEEINKKVSDEFNKEYFSALRSEVNNV